MGDVCSTSRPKLVGPAAGVLGGIVAAIVALTNPRANADVLKYAGKTQVRSCTLAPQRHMVWNSPQLCFSLIAPAACAQLLLWTCICIRRQDLAAVTNVQKSISCLKWILQPKLAAHKAWPMMREAACGLIP